MRFYIKRAADGERARDFDLLYRPSPSSYFLSYFSRRGDGRVQNIHYAELFIREYGRWYTDGGCGGGAGIKFK